MSFLAENITTMVRLKPGNSIWDTTENHLTCDKGSFYFNKIFDNKTNAVLFEYCWELMQVVLQGINTTCFTYGQTSSGKTYTLLGSDLDPGILPLTLQQLFTIDDLKIKISYIEVYNEVLKDLLDPRNQPKLQTSNNRVVVSNLKEVEIKTLEEAIEYLKIGEHSRKYGCTDVNEHSSRSHALFQIHVQRQTEDRTTLGVLTLVDLAGSERIKHTNAEGVRLKEGQMINKSLLALGTVIQKLSEKQVHVPFRDSKLTRILQNSLGGFSRTLAICCISPTLDYLEESISTLKFAMKTMRIENKPLVNETHEEQLLEQYKLKINELECKLEQQEDSLDIVDQLEYYKQQEISLQMQVQELTTIIGQKRSHSEDKVDNKKRKIAADSVVALIKQPSFELKTPLAYTPVPIKFDFPMRQIISFIHYATYSPTKSLKEPIPTYIPAQSHSIHIKPHLLLLYKQSILLSKLNYTTKEYKSKLKHSYDTKLSPLSCKPYIKAIRLLSKLHKQPQKCYVPLEHSGPSMQPTLKINYSAYYRIFYYMQRCSLKSSKISLLDSIITYRTHSALYRSLHLHQQSLRSSNFKSIESFNRLLRLKHYLNKLHIIPTQQYQKVPYISKAIPTIPNINELDLFCTKLSKKSDLYLQMIHDLESSKIEFGNKIMELKSLKTNCESIKSILTHPNGYSFNVEKLKSVLTQLQIPTKQSVIEHQSYSFNYSTYSSITDQLNRDYEDEKQKIKSILGSIKKDYIASKKKGHPKIDELQQELVKSKSTIAFLKEKLTGKFNAKEQQDKEQQQIKQSLREAQSKIVMMDGKVKKVEHERDTLAQMYKELVI